MGNHTIAERMCRHDPSAMLHAPLRTLLYADPDGDTQLAIDQPSLLFASYHDPRIADVGRELDTLLAGLIIQLGGDPPPQLQTGEPGLRTRVRPVAEPGIEAQSEWSYRWQRTQPRQVSIRTER